MPAAGQVRAVSLDELKGALAPGDRVSIVRTSGEPVAGKVLQIEDDMLQIRPELSGGRIATGPVVVPYTSIRSLDRPRDPTGNGAAIGAAVGAGIGGAMFAIAYAGDANEVDEWAGIYIGIAGVLAGSGALIGWGVDRTHSKPPLRFVGVPRASTRISVSPFAGRRTGVRVRVSF